MDIRKDGSHYLATDEVSGRTIRVPVVLTVGHNDYALRQLFLAAMMTPTRFAGVSIVSEGPHGMTPLEFRAKVPTHLWHPHIVEHPTGGGPDVHPAHEAERLALIAHARAGTLDAKHFGVTE